MNANRRRRMLPSTLALGPNRHPKDQVRDAETFCKGLLEETLRRFNMHLDDRPEDYDDTLSLLLRDLWRLTLRFQPERNECFADYARAILRRRAIDHCQRRLLGKNGSRKHHYLHAQLLDENPHGTRHPRTLTDEPLDLDPDRNPTRGRLPDLRNRDLARHAHILGIPTPRRAA